MSSRLRLRVARPANRDGSYIDWTTVRRRADARPGEWVKVGSVKETTATAVRNGSIRKLQGLVVRTRKEGAAPGRVHLYVMKEQE